VFAVSDCEHGLGGYSKLKFELTMFNADENHVSVEDKGLASLFFYLSVMFFIALGANLLQTYRRFVYHEELDSHLMLLNIAICLEFISLIFELLNQSTYQANGYGISALDFLGRGCAQLAHLTLTILLISMAEGWTITVPNFPNPEVYFSVFLFGGMAKFFIAAISHLTEDRFDRFSEYEGYTGAALLSMRLALFGWFLFNTSELFNKAAGRLKLFVSRFTLTGSLYFLSHPLVVLASFYFDPYLHNWVVVLGSVSIQVVLMLALSLMFARQRSDYNRVRVSGSCLPGRKAE
jgi:hypothetical protein